MTELERARDAAIEAVARAEQAQKDGLRPFLQWCLNSEARDAVAAFEQIIVDERRAANAN